MRYSGTTTQRGYGHTHQAERKRRLTQYRPGDPCAIGGEPLPWPIPTAPRYVDLPHDHINGGYLPGLACRWHNRRDGGIRGGKARWRNRRRTRWVTSQRW